MELKEAFIHWFLECSPYSYEILKQQGSPDYKVQVGFGVLKRRVVRMMLTHIDVTRRHLRERFESDETSSCLRQIHADVICFHLGQR